MLAAIALGSALLLLSGTPALGGHVDDPIYVFPPENENTPLRNSLGPERRRVQSFTRTTSTLPLGAQSADDELVVVRTYEPLPDVISPFERIDSGHIDELTRLRPFIRRTDSVLDDMRHAQHQYLRERGYILGVRTHVNDRAITPVSLEPPARTVRRTRRTGRTMEPIIAVSGTRVLEPQLKPDSVLRVRIDRTDDSK